MILRNKQIFTNWASGKTIGITGGQGVLGKKLGRQLLTLGARRVISFDSQRTTSFDSTGCIHHVVGDILKLDDLLSAFYNCNMLFHLAALVAVGQSNDEPLQYFRVNSLGTAMVMEACRLLEIPKVVYASTGHVYGIPQHLPVSENHAIMPLSPYAASKLAGEAVIQGYAAAFGVSYNIVRLSNLYSAASSEETVIGLALSQIMAGSRIALRNLYSIRDFIYVDDVVDALVHLATTGKNRHSQSIVNVSSGTGVAVIDIARTLVDITQKEGYPRAEIVQIAQDFVEMIPEFTLDNQLIYKMTGWRPQIDLRLGLQLSLQEKLRKDNRE